MCVILLQLNTPMDVPAEGSALFLVPGPKVKPTSNTETEQKNSQGSTDRYSSEEIRFSLGNIYETLDNPRDTMTSPLRR
jgi:hypothetical protein